MARPLRPSPNCLNCGAAVATRFCAECGQENTTYRVSLARLVGDLFEELFQLESRLWRSLATLFRRPGLLTLDYNAGRRVRYTTPLRLYLIASVAYFFVGSVLPQTKVPSNVRFDLADVNADKDVQNASPFVKDIFQRVQANAKDPQATIARVRHALTEWAPRIAAGLVPLMALLTWLVFRRPKLYFVEHLVFALHAHATAFFLLLVTEVLPFGIVGVIAFFAMLALLFLAARRVFEQSRLATALKLSFVAFVYSMFLGTGIGVVAALGFFAVV